MQGNPGTQLTSFVGRGRETAELVQLVETGRLVTLTGPGGSGKSRLAQVVADRLAPSFPGSAWWVGLASLTDEAAVAAASAEVLRLPEAPDRRSAESVAARLRGERTLLVYDNCEHLVGAVAELVEWLLKSCPELSVLATSQEILGVPGEVTYAVPPLAVPGPGAWTSAPGLDDFAAVRLFRERAGAAAPGFKITDANAAAVAWVCQRLEGLPLAVELAAAQVPLLSPAQIAERLDDCSRVLVGNGRAVLARHRTLRATMDWSYRLLPEAERSLFGRLSVFPGSFTLDAVEAIDSTSDEGGAETLELLSGLVNRSLVTPKPGEHVEEVRYRMLEPVRQFAVRRLAESSDRDAVRERHARYFVGLAERAEPRLSEADQSQWLDLLEAERDNLRSAVRWCLEGWPEGALRLAAAQWRFCYLRGHYGQGREWLDEALHAADDAPAALRAKALVASGMLAHLECDYGLAVTRLHEGLDVYRGLDDRRGTAQALQVLGSIARERGDYARSRVLHEESMGLWRALGDHQGVARSLNYLGFAAWLEEDHERADRLCTEARARFCRAGDDEGTAWSLISLGTVALYRDDHASARSLLRECLGHCRTVGYREGVAWSLNQLGVLALREGDHAEADRLLRESLTVHRVLGDRWRTASVLEGLAGTAVVRGEPGSAVRLLAAAARIRETIGTPVPPVERAAHQETVAAARTAVGADFQDLWSIGQTAPVEQLIDERPPTLARVTEAAESPLRILGFGSARVYRDHTMLGPADWTYAKPRELLFLLLSESECTKEQIGAALWPWSSPVQLRNSFHKALHNLRRALGRPDWIHYQQGRYAFNRSLDYTFDVEAFQSGLARAHAVPAEAVTCLTEVVGLYNGDFLADLPGEQWIEERRSKLSRSYEQALLTLGELHAAAGRHAEAAEVYLRAVAHDALLEAAHRELIRSYARLGERGRALRHYQTLVEVLRDELDVAPSPQTSALCAALRHDRPL